MTTPKPEAATPEQVTDVRELIERLGIWADDMRQYQSSREQRAANAFQNAADALSAALEREEALREALRDIVDPISRMQREADKVGAILDGASAVRIADNPEYLRGIARTAMENTNGN